MTIRLSMAKGDDDLMITDGTTVDDVIGSTVGDDLMTADETVVGGH